ncbi:hypothetical protein PR048_013084 [Dryococelus australis]|uniref:Uncharacterized protein n=1 Tax=Dryococelus australis TaxID=614101 RepID=A0ABQ9HR87_9NEOP|nr:hypothetical protein PR048_013084 [Dryococelus australis]
MDKYVPLLNKPVKGPPAPRLTQSITERMSKRVSTFRLFKRARKRISLLAAQIYCRPNRHREPCSIVLNRSGLKKIDKRKLTVLTMFYLSEAFKTVDYNILKNKMSSIFILSVSAVLWFQS